MHCLHRFVVSPGVALMEYMRAGGPVMIPIALFATIALVTFLERLWSLRRAKVVPASYVVKVTDMIRQGRFAEATTLSRATPVAAARIIEAALEARDRSHERLKERIEEVGRREAAELERFAPVLGTIAAISPLLGLLGTVGGMILTFKVIETVGLGNVASLAGGISQALVTTFAGLTVGIPTLIGHRWVLSRVDSLVLDLEEVAAGVLEELEVHREAGAA